MYCAIPRSSVGTNRPAAFRHTFIHQSLAPASSFQSPNMTRLTLLLVSILLTVASAQAAQKNVLLFVADDLGRTVGCYDDANARTPNIDKLAAQGTRFTHAFCTTASCSPSRSVILTGLYSHANGQYGLAHADHNFKSKPAIKGLPVLLRAAGYKSACIGKYHVAPDEVYGFDELPQVKGGPRNPVGLAEAAKKFIAASGASPFFLYVCTSDPHRAPKGFGNDGKQAEEAAKSDKPVKFDADKIVVPPFLPDSPAVRQELAEYYEAVARADAALGRVLEVLRETGHDKDTLVMFLSDNGIPFCGAKTTQYDSGTRLPLIVRLPDQKQPGTVCNAMVNWADLAPTVLDYVGQTHSKDSPNIAAPSKAQVSGKASAPGRTPAMQGRSFLKILDEREPSGWDVTFGSHNFHEVTMYYPMRTVRTRKYKYILNIAHQLPYPIAADLYNSETWQATLKSAGNSAEKSSNPMYGKRTLAAYLQRPRHELYDLEADPDEVLNLADRPEHAARLAELQQQVRKFQDRTDDPWLIKYSHE